MSLAVFPLDEGKFIFQLGGDLAQGSPHLSIRGTFRDVAKPSDLRSDGRTPVRVVHAQMTYGA